MLNQDNKWSNILQNRAKQGNKIEKEIKITLNEGQWEKTSCSSGEDQEGLYEHPQSVSDIQHLQCSLLLLPCCTLTNNNN